MYISIKRTDLYRLGTLSERQILMINLTASNGNEVKIRCLKSGSNVFLSKQIDDVKPQSRVSKLLGVRRHAETMKLNEMLQQSTAGLERKNRQLKAALEDR